MDILLAGLFNYLQEKKNYLRSINLTPFAGVLEKDESESLAITIYS